MRNVLYSQSFIQDVLHTFFSFEPISLNRGHLDIIHSIFYFYLGNFIRSQWIGTEDNLTCFLVSFEVTFGK